jgi:ubiquitin C-terminal hydrolase
MLYSPHVKNVVEELSQVVLDRSMAGERLKSRLELYDCLQAFSSREELDHNNPWFCPVCRRNQTATKTLSGSQETSRD